MIALNQIRKDWREAKPTQTLIGLHGFVDGKTFLTKSGDLGVVFQVDGVDSECLDHSERHEIARRFEAAVRGLDERFQLLQYFVKRRGFSPPDENHSNPVIHRALEDRSTFLRGRAEQICTIGIYFVLLMSPSSRERGSLSWRRTASVLQANLLKSVEALANKADSFAIQLRDVLDIQILSKDDAFKFLRGLLNFAPQGTEVPAHTDHMDYFLCDTNIECHRDHLMVGDRFVQVLSLKEPASKTFAHQLRGLEAIPCDLVLAASWRREPSESIRRQIHSKRRHFHNSKASLTNYIGDTPASAQELLIDESAGGLVTELGECLKEIEIHGNYFGRYSLTIVLIGGDLASVRGAAAECVKTLTTYDAHVIEERYNLLNAYLSIVPGNRAYNLREFWLLNTNFADLSFLFAADIGDEWNAQLRASHLAILESPSSTPYFLNLHVQDVAHTLVLGATGSGKSFFLNFVVTNLQKYDPLTYIFDLGGSYEHLTSLFGGNYLQVGSKKAPFRINPFCLDPTSENLQFLCSFARVLVESGGHRLTNQDERDLYQQISNIYELAPEQRRLFTLSNILNRTLAPHLQKWVQGGQYADIFDNSADTLTFSRFQAFDFEGLDLSPQILEPLLFYILHRANAAIYDPALTTTFKALVLDEAWRFFRNETVRSYVVEAVKTWRKRNAAVIVATQSSDDLRQSHLLNLMVESCPTKIFLANPGMDRSTYRSLFHLNETEADLIASLTPKHQVLIKRPDLSKVLNLNVDPIGYWLYTSDPFDAQRRREAFERHGFEQGLEELTRRCM